MMGPRFYHSSNKTKIALDGFIDLLRVANLKKVSFDSNGLRERQGRGQQRQGRRITRKLEKILSKGLCLDKQKREGKKGIVRK